MQNDRVITISTAGSRKAMNWQPQAMKISELFDRLKTPLRDRETLSAYMSLKKAQQDELKDKGGFVGGEITGRRKKGSVRSRDVITLDMDNCPLDSTSLIIQRIASLGMMYAVYSTRKHSPAAPRLRVVVPIDRTITGEEYEPIARKLAALIQPELTWFDPTTFQVERLMYWPSCCVNSEYIFTYEDKPLLSADGMLALYENWLNVASWPQVPGEQKLRERSAAKQGDPTEKKGTVGAFCKVYTVVDAMEKILPGAYIPTEQGDRYTFAGGSTAGGAIVYDDDKFLFSHHATDPCSGQLVNAFDLVRLHKFGHLDDDAKEGTPSNRLPSYAEMCEFSLEQPEVKRLIETEKGESVLADFGSLAIQTKQHPDTVAALGQLEDEVLTTDLVEKILDLFGIVTRLNIISNQSEISGVPLSWSTENAVNNLPTLIRDICRKAGVRGVSKDAIMDSLAQINDQKRYNPVLEMMYSIEWDGIDRLQMIYNILGLSDDFSKLLTCKWLHQCVAMAHNDIKNPYGADGILTLTGSQGLGKTSFFRWLAYDSKWFNDGIALNTSNKDIILKAIQVWIAELGELEGTLARDLPGMKAFATSEKDIVRAPYARTAVTRARLTSFGATVNGDEFLKDETGNRRFWTIAVNRIDLEQMRSLSSEWVRQLWAQMLKMYLQNPQGFRLTAREKQQLETVNAKHLRLLPYEEEILDLLDFNLPYDKWVKMTAAELAARMCPSPTAERVGRVLTKLSKSDQRLERIPGDKCRVRMLPLKQYATGYTNVADDSSNRS